jgi:hypothetical protein
MALQRHQEPAGIIHVLEGIGRDDHFEPKARIEVAHRARLGRQAGGPKLGCLLLAAIYSGYRLRFPGQSPMDSRMLASVVGVVV